MLHYSSIYNVIEKPGCIFSLKFVKMKTGEIVFIDQCICTSSHFRPRTINVKIVASEEIRKIRTCSMIELNGVPVYI